MNTTYTPGPWINEFPYIKTMHTETIAKIIDSNETAKLIAAAPDLLEALQKIVNNWSNLHHKDLMQARTAINKATI